MTVALPSLYQQFIHKSRYARWEKATNKREEWSETVDRYVDYMGGVAKQLAGENAALIHSFSTKADSVRKYIKELKVMPSMRALMTAGEALSRDNVAGYNCAYTVADSPESLSEIMYILLCGAGVGASVEKRYVDKLPRISPLISDDSGRDVDSDYPCNTVVFEDSKDGWYNGFKEYLNFIFHKGIIPDYNLSKIRKKGERLKVFGGRASGPEPLQRLLEFVRDLVLTAAGRKLTSQEVADIICMIGDVVVCGGVRRSAIIILFDLDDKGMLNYKSGAWWEHAPYRRLANVSAVFEEKPTREQWDTFWTALRNSGSGEPGIFSRKAAQEKAKESGRDPTIEYGTNPCSEIILRPHQFCNLSEVVVRPDDTLGDLTRKISAATFLGTVQSTLTDFHKLSPKWKENCEEERLLGVSLTGICDHVGLSDPSGHVIGKAPKNNSSLPVVKAERVSTPDALAQLRELAEVVNKKAAHELGINASKSITCVKPSGTVSQLVDSASGLHPRYSEYYIRRVTVNTADTLAQFFIDNGVQYEQSIYNADDVLFSFPMKAPDTGIMRDDMSAERQLKLWEMYAEKWCDHKPSVTIYIKEEEWEDIGQYTFDNFDKISGVAFLPFDGGTYKQAPYEEISKEKYDELYAITPQELDWEAFLEKEDNTTSSQELACAGGACEIL